MQHCPASQSSLSSWYCVRLRSSGSFVESSDVNHSPKKPPAISVTEGSLLASDGT